MLPSFNEYLGDGYWVCRTYKYVAVIRRATDGWYGGACRASNKSVPLHGPYRFKRTAKKKAMEQLTLVSNEIVNKGLDNDIED
jgi:hypothetical protein